MADYIMCVRNITKKGDFGAEPGATKFLKVPSTVKLQKPEHKIPRKKDWFKAVIDEAIVGKNASTGEDIGDVLVFIHGYNNESEIVLRRHRLIKKGLKKVGYKGAVISFEWPSNDIALNYLEDRSDAKKTAIRLVTDCIQHFSRIQRPECEINVHLLAHSTGAFIIREAFDDADDRPKIAGQNWTVSQIMLIGGDVSSRSMSANDSKSSSIYRHCVRLTNYSNPYDSVLKLSNVKRIGVAPRVGRIGLPDNSPINAVNVNCGKYYDANKDRFKNDAIGTPCHSWHIGDDRFAKDMYHTICGDIDRFVIPGRVRDGDGNLFLTV